MTNNDTPQQRLRLTYAKGEALKYISHLDLQRTWERAFRRARLPMAYSQGFNPRPRFQMASALPVGVSGRSELLDIWLVEPLSGEDVLSRLRPVLPGGLEVLSAEEVELRTPALQAQMRAADYQAEIHTAEPAGAIEGRIEALMASQAIPRRRMQKGEWQTYDLRPLIQVVTVEAAAEGAIRLAMRLEASPRGAGRPEEVLDALGLALSRHRVERTRLYFAEPSD